MFPLGMSLQSIRGIESCHAWQPSFGMELGAGERRLVLVIRPDVSLEGFSLAERHVTWREVSTAEFFLTQVDGLVSLEAGGGGEALATFGFVTSKVAFLGMRSFDVLL